MMSLSCQIVQFTKLKTTGDILLFSVYGVLFVLGGLLLLSMTLFLFKFINKREMKKLEAKKGNKDMEEIPAVEELKHFDDDIVTAIIAAIAIEQKLYHEDTLSELTFRYRGENPSGWQISDMVNSGS
ncbi:MAG TPA: hypothetical protein ENJ25_03375 [Firmicutes bacterium]|jgi:hypothetical protein|uniref:Oxaloacetate decarboxylase gamma chain n=1 Tax=candidate division TA06 bacterium TaxID=2250710 RepID=A0A660S4N9_UNCT6|nr:MAG: hypothetical protein DRP44_08300 [candidate division TA06 bacterium]HFD05164.1 hypothetical protein [Bacillota bacterium]